MICLLCPSFDAAEKYARSHMLASNEYFWANSIEHIKGREAFHILIVGQFEHVGYFERLLAEAQICGMRNRR